MIAFIISISISISFSISMSFSISISMSISISIPICEVTFPLYLLSPKLKHETPTALRSAACTDSVLAALMKMQIGSGSGSGSGTKQGWVSKKRQRVDFYTNDDEDSEGEGGGGGGGGGDCNSGYGGLIPQFTVSLLNLAVESTQITAQRASPHTVTPMDR